MKNSDAECRFWDLWNSALQDTLQEKINCSNVNSPVTLVEQITNTRNWDYGQRVQDVNILGSNETSELSVLSKYTMFLSLGQCEFNESIGALFVYNTSCLENGTKISSKFYGYIKNRCNYLNDAQICGFNVFATPSWSTRLNRLCYEREELGVQIPFLGGGYRDLCRDDKSAWAP